MIDADDTNGPSIDPSSSIDTLDIEPSVDDDLIEP